MSASRSYEAALLALRTQRPNALALARRATHADPGFVAAHLLEAWLLLWSRDTRDFEAAGWVFARLSRMAMSAREGRQAAAIATAVDGDYAGAARLLDEIVAEDPHDLVALASAQVFDYYLGNPAAQKRRTSHALPHWSASDPGYHAMLSMHAFGLVECGDYGVAEEAALRALELEPRDVRAHHVVSHVFEMQGRAAEGVRWMGSRSGWWTDAGAASTHLWWHLALHQLELGRERLALEVYDRRLQGGSLSELIDASALLWRLQLAGYDCGDRFSALAERWQPFAEDAHCAFNDLHAMMAFAGAGQWDWAERLLAAQVRRVEKPWGANRDMTRLVGLPACRALVAFARQDYAGAEALLRALPPVAHRIGGSHAQRDILQLTRAAAAQRRPRLVA
jgi:tetratricopeptide (TPR) repeat protein